MILVTTAEAAILMPLLRLCERHGFHPVSEADAEALATVTDKINRHMAFVVLATKAATPRPKEPA